MDFQSLLHSVQSRQPFGCLDGPSGLTGKVYRFRPAPTISVLLIERPHIAGRVYLTGKLSAARTSGEPPEHLTQAATPTPLSCIVFFRTRNQHARFANRRFVPHFLRRK